MHTDRHLKENKQINKCRHTKTRYNRRGPGTIEHKKLSDYNIAIDAVATLVKNRTTGNNYTTMLFAVDTTRAINNNSNRIMTAMVVMTRITIGSSFDPCYLWAWLRWRPPRLVIVPGHDGLVSRSSFACRIARPSLVMWWCRMAAHESDGAHKPKKKTHIDTDDKNIASTTMMMMMMLRRISKCW